MKLDLLNKQWLDIVFEGRNKVYGAYDLRQNNTKTNVRAFLIGAFIFSLAIATPLLISLIPDSSDDDASLNEKITTVKLPPKEEKPKENVPPPPPPPPKVDQVKFVKPVVAKTDEVTEEPPKVEEIKDKKLGDENIKGNDEAPLTLEPVGNGPVTQQVVEEDNNVYNSAGVEVKPEFPGGMGKFDNFIKNNLTLPEGEEINGKIIVQFTVEKDGTLSDIKVLKDVGFGSDKEALKMFRKCPKWIPAEQNGRKVRCTFVKPIAVQVSAE